jgi:hypothetical protein
MSRVYHTGFEWQRLACECSVPSNTAGTESIDTTIKHSGAASLECSGTIPTENLSGIGHGVTMAADVYARWYVYVDSLTVGGLAVATMDLFTTAGATNCASIQLGNETGTLTMHVWYNNFGTELANTATLSFDTWHRIEMYYKTSGAAGADQITVRVDGTQVANSAALTLTNAAAFIQAGLYNGTAGDITTDVVYYDDIAVNTTADAVNNSWCGDANIAVLVPVAAGNNAATAGTYDDIAEVPPSDTRGGAGDGCIELDANPTIGDYTVTAPATAGIGDSDTINAIAVLGYLREESAGTSNYTVRIKSKSAGTVTSSTSRDAGNATLRTNPSGTTNFGEPLISQKIGRASCRERV